MARFDKWFGATVVAAAMALVVPGTATAKHGADDLTPEAQKPEKGERPGHKLAKHGADDLTPEQQKPEKGERPGHKLA
jgi:hypothetical protein